MCDGMDSSEAFGDIFNYGVNDDYLNLLHEADESVVRKPDGLTDDFKILQDGGSTAEKSN